MMARRLAFGLCLLLGLTLWGSGGLRGTAMAQEAAAHVVVVDFGRVMRESAAAQSIGIQISAVRAAAQAEFSAIEDELVRIQAELTGQRATLPTEQFEEKRRDFERRFTEAQRAAEARRTAIDAAESEAVGRVRAALIRAIEAIAEERAAQIVLDRADVVVVAPEFDISELALERLNEALPDVEVNVRTPGQP